MIDPPSHLVKIIICISVFISQPTSSDPSRMKQLSRKQMQENYAAIKKAMYSHSAATPEKVDISIGLNPYSQHLLMAESDQAAPVMPCNDTSAKRMISVGVEGFGSQVLQALNLISFCERERCNVEVYWCSPYSCYAGDRTVGPNGWLQYFRPVCGGGQMSAPWRGDARGDSSDLDRMVDAHKTWYHEAVETKKHGIFGYYVGPWRGKEQSVYDEQWYALQRARGARLISRYIRFRPEVVAAANEAWKQLTGDKRSAPKVIGVHMRGTDVLDIDRQFAERVMAHPDDYLPLVRAYLKVQQGSLVFVATDDQRLLEHVKSSWPQDIVSVLRWRNISRPAQGFKAHCSSKDDSYQAGLELLVDVLLLSRCSYLVHSASNIPELAVMINPSLHSNSFNLRFSSGHEGNWLYRQMNGKNGYLSQLPHN